MVAVILMEPVIVEKSRQDHSISLLRRWNGPARFLRCEQIKTGSDRVAWFLCPWSCCQVCNQLFQLPLQG